MYSNLGKKIQTIGKVMGWLLLFAGVIMWFMKCIVSGYRGDAVIGWISLVAGVAGLISSWFICAFGQLVDDVHAMREMQVLNAQSSENQESNDKKVVEAGGWKCRCGKVNASYISSCSCGLSKFDQ